jgi:predicted lipoprotein with Yx(FWY)xxD motif
MKTLLTATAVLAATALCAAAQAHVAVQPATAVAGADETLRFVVGHGCDGQPTTALRVELPPTLGAIAPQAKAGWHFTLDNLPSGAVALTWRGELAAHQADTFPVGVRLPRTAGPLTFAATQTCGGQSVRWDEAVVPGGAKPAHPAPMLTLTAAEPAAAPAAPVAASDGRLPKEIKRLPDGTFGDAGGRPLYTFNFDTMVGMSHCEDDCAKMWPPLAAPKGAKAFGDWSVIPRPEGATQWAYRTKPLYTYSEDRPGEPARGLAAPNWKLAK